MSDAVEDACPPILARPPWVAFRERKPIVVTGVTALPFADYVDWAPGEQEDVLRRRVRSGTDEVWPEPVRSAERDAAMDVIAQKPAELAAWRKDHADLQFKVPDGWTTICAAVMEMTDAGALRHLSGPFPTLKLTRQAGGNWLPLLARFDAAAFNWMLELADWVDAENERSLWPQIAKVVSSAVGRLLGQWVSADLECPRTVARRWLLAHPEAGAIGIVPDAVAELGERRTHAEDALRWMTRRGQSRVVEAVAQRYGPTVQAAVTEILETDFGFDQLPTMPDFWQPSAWTRPRVAGGLVPLPMLDPLGVLLKASTPAQAHPRLAEVQARCDARSLAAFAEDLLAAWLAVGAPPSESWALHSLAWLGDDASIPKLKPLLQRWPEQTCEVLARLLHKENAPEQVRVEAARLRKLSVEELKDRLEPVPPQPSDPARIAAVEAAWQRLEEQLDERFPQVASYLAPGASDSDLNALEQRLGFALPEDFRAFYRRHNGARGKDGYITVCSTRPPTYTHPKWTSLHTSYGLLANDFLSLSAVSAELDVDHGSVPVDSDEQLTYVGPVKHNRWCSTWIPICSDPDGDLVCYDLSPRPEGHVGQIIHVLYSESALIVVADNLADYLAMQAEDLERGDLRWDRRLSVRSYAPPGGETWSEVDRIFSPTGVSFDVSRVPEWTAPPGVLEHAFPSDHRRPDFRPVNWLPLCRLLDLETANIHVFWVDELPYNNSDALSCVQLSREWGLVLVPRQYREQSRAKILARAVAAFLGAPYSTDASQLMALTGEGTLWSSEGLATVRSRALQLCSRTAAEWRQKLDLADLLAAGAAHYAQKAWTAAREAFSSATTLAPQDFEARYRLGQTELQLKNLPESQRQLLSATVLKPDHHGAWMFLSQVQQALGDTRSAIASRRRCLDLEPANAHDHAALGQLLSSSGSPEQAVEHLEKACQLNPGKAAQFGWDVQLQKAKSSSAAGE